MNIGSVMSQLKINFNSRVDKPDEVRLLDSSTLNFTKCLKIAAKSKILNTQKEALLVCEGI